ncbi:MAG: lipid-A-disaccharide synthase [Gammaproteobacteria bacterium]|nr:lipid-A-disaccharide synthase [Gammaproteobacteria bacterium]
MLVAGEASGDLHAAHLVEALKALDPQIHFMGMGSTRMRAAGVELLVDSANIAVVGLVEVLSHYPEIKTAMRSLRSALMERRPALLILIDYPDFNLRLAATAKQAGVKVLYYISPQVWAWRAGRVKKIRRLVDMMAVVFPFEVPIYQSAHVPVRYTGHPLVDEVVSDMNAEQAREQLGLKVDTQWVGLFPGSRKSELKRLLPILVQTAEILLERFPQLQFVLPLAPGLTRNDLDSGLDDAALPITVVEDSIHEVIQSCDVIVTASGTATLQIALLEKPMAIIYRIAPLSYWIARFLINVKHVGLVNIVLNRRAVREFIQQDAHPQRIANEISRLLTDESYATQIHQDLLEVRKKLGEGGGSQRVAKLALEIMGDD